MYHNGSFYVSNILKRSGQTITEAIAKSTGKDILAAEAIKRELNVLTKKHPNAELQAAVTNEVDAMINEITRVLDYYYTRSKSPVTGIYLSGGGALLQGFDAYMQEHMRIPVRHAADLFVMDKASENRGLSFLLNAYAATLREDNK